MDIGWSFKVVTRSGVKVDIHPTTTGSISSDLNSAIRRTLTGLVFLPSEYRKFQELARDGLEVTLTIDGVAYPFGTYYATESSYQPDVLIDDETGLVTDLYHIDFGDGSAKLRRGDELPRVAYSGADPSQEMIKYITETGLDHAITGAVASISGDVFWAPFTTYEQIISQLATVAGHRAVWVDHRGVVRSKASATIDSEIINLVDLGPTAGSILINESYLSAPNRVVVYDDQSSVALVGFWNAPAGSPHSESKRGYVLAAGSAQQGLASSVHAQRVAELIGEQLSSRVVTATILPTAALDGPVVLQYRGALWLCGSWGMSTSGSSLMNISATELVT